MPPAGCPTARADASERFVCTAAEGPIILDLGVPHLYDGSAGACRVLDNFALFLSASCRHAHAHTRTHARHLAHTRTHTLRCRAAIATTTNLCLVCSRHPLAHVPSARIPHACPRVWACCRFLSRCRKIVQEDSARRGASQPLGRRYVYLDGGENCRTLGSQLELAPASLQKGHRLSGCVGYA